MLRLIRIYVRLRMRKLCVADRIPLTNCELCTALIDGIAKKAALVVERQPLVEPIRPLCALLCVRG